MSLPQISVIVPVYNVAKYLQQCIDSLMAQTILDKLELIFVNDASPDNCIEILRENEKKHPDKIKVIDSKENLCQGGARNLGMRQARGEYIGFVDSDDFVAPTMYERLYDKAVSSGADATFIQYASVPDETKYEVLPTHEYLKYAEDGEALFQWDPLLLRLEGKNLREASREEITDLLVYPVGGIYCGLWRKSVILDNGLFFPEHVKYEDNLWGTLIRLYLGSIAFVPSIEYFYRQNPTSTTHIRYTSFIRDRMFIENSLLSEAKKRGFFEPYYSAWELTYIVRYAFNTCTGAMSSLYDNVDYELVNRVLNDLRTEFPSWRRNKYYINFSMPTTRKRKLLMYIFTLSPKFMLAIFRVYTVMKLKLKKILQKK